MASKKTNTTFAFTDAQSNLFDFVVNVKKQGLYSKTSFIIESIRDEITDYLGIPADVPLDDEQLLKLAVKKNENMIANLMKGAKKHE